jgi:alkanesulfonate monooxygenase SsuD/methylene tetrahydromethanopterin reductase-like flavin-dependent oxidoreductase (luciferase family)
LNNLHLGLTPWNFSDLSAASLCQQAQFAESCGYESIWLPENHFGENALPDPLTLLASIAGATQKIRLGTTSYLLTLRNPLQAAEQVAVLDQLSGGRLILGVGRGFAPEMLRAFHVPAKEKRRIFAWTLGLMRDAWGGKSISLDGNMEHAVEVHPRPAQRPHPPLWVAAFGPKALAQAGTLGLPYLCSPMESIATLESNYAQHAQAAAAAGVTLAPTVPLMRTVFVSDNADLIAQVKGELGSKIENQRLQAGEGVDDWTLIGTPMQVRDKLLHYQQRLGMTHLVSTRLRIGGMDEADLRQSVLLLAEIVAGKVV